MGRQLRLGLQQAGGGDGAWSSGGRREQLVGPEQQVGGRSTRWTFNVELQEDEGKVIRVQDF